MKSYGSFTEKVTKLRNKIMRKNMKRLRKRKFIKKSLREINLSGYEIFNQRIYNE